MHLEDRRRRFHEAIVHMLYPPPSPPPPQQEDEKEPLGIVREGLNVNSIPDVDDVGERSSFSSDEEEDECGPEKLTRAQRKRLRKKKLKEAVPRRRKIIGPLLPSLKDDDDGAGDFDVRESEPTGVRSNATEELDASALDKSEPIAPNTHNKLKHRRMAKRLARERKKLEDGDNRELHGHCGFNE